MLLYSRFSQMATADWLNVNENTYEDTFKSGPLNLANRFLISYFSLYRLTPESPFSSVRYPFPSLSGNCCFSFHTESRGFGLRFPSHK